RIHADRRHRIHQAEEAGLLMPSPGDWEMPPETHFIQPAIGSDDGPNAHAFKPVSLAGQKAADLRGISADLRLVEYNCQRFLALEREWQTRDDPADATAFFDAALIR